MKPNSALIIFVRNPVLGKVKTRIAATIGNEAALRVYKKLLQHTHDTVLNIETDKYVFYSDYINKDDLWENDVFNKELQNSIDLGERMKSAFEFLFEKGYQNIGIIGSDCYDLSQDILENAFKVLNETSVVIGPAKDGGYYFLGMNSFVPQLFEHKKWSSSSVLTETTEQLNSLDIPYYSLPALIDVDEEKDISFTY